MQTPAGYEILDGRVVPTDWLAVIFNPSFPYRLAHMGIAAFLATALMVGASGAWHLLRGDRSPAVKKMFAMAMGMLLLVAPLQAVVGDIHGLNTLKHQPAKIAAIEGHWENEPGAGLGRPVPRAEVVPARRPAQRDRGVLVGSHHGRAGHADDPAGRLGAVDPVARPLV
ncbi:hypothetical protein G6F68_015691 [Rhizopus microsporus]|nr:hypothetical protein G6F68_015691 [Rhizopus microsporus]